VGSPRGDLILVLANVVYATSFAASRIALDGGVPPATLALLRLLIATAVLLPMAVSRGRPGPGSPYGGSRSRRDRWRIAWMGIVGFGAAYGWGLWGLVRSTATHASLLIVVEPIAVIVLSPLLLGERLHRREAIGAAFALLGTIVVVLNGIPGVTAPIVPHWRGDVLLVLSGLAFGSYSLIGRDVLARQEPVTVTAWSIVWGSGVLAPVALAEWLDGRHPEFTVRGLVATFYLGVVITALGYLVWNSALRRVPAPRAAISLTIQPLVGALLGTVVLGEPLSPFVAVGGTLIVAGLLVAAPR
jgi:drug/metabolite transporter (DMT)-like permease